MLGKTIYYLDFKKRAVFSGTVLQQHISSDGHGAFLIKADETGNVIQKETSICYCDEEVAKENLPAKLLIADEMEEIAKTTQKRLDDLRLQLLGKPEFKYLIGGTQQ